MINEQAPAPKHAGGAPKKKTPARLKRVYAAARAGAKTWVMLAQAAGVDADTLRAWRDEDPEIDRRVEQERAALSNELVQTIYAEATVNWKAAKELLERINPDYRPDRKVELSGEVTAGPAEIVIVVEGEDDSPDGDA